MKKLIFISFLALAGGLTNLLNAQITGSGTSGKLPLFNGSQTITNSNITQHNGNIGIGTTTPKEHFQIGSDFVIHNGGTKIIARNWDYAYINNQWKSIRQINGASAGFSIGSDGSISLWNDENSTAGTDITPNYRLKVSSNGNVGIGTTTPNSKLTLKGSSSDIEINILDENSAGIILNDNEAPTSQYGKMLFNSASNALSFYVNHTDPKMVITKEGNIGIGTASPHGDADLHIYNGTSTVLLGSPSGTTSALKLWGNHSNTSYIQAGSSQINGNLTISKYQTTTGSIDLFKVYATKSYFSGDVGIGTASPQRKLHVKASHNMVQLRLERTGSDVGFADLGSNGGHFRVYAGGYDAGHKFIIDGTTGNVGIGTTTATAKLTVNGKIEAEEIEVKNIGADFVFEDDYNLRSLSELEQFIKTNKHLPEIAPAVETEKGVKLGEFNEKLLQKIEELTLYTIEQEKTIEKQQDLLETLIERLEALEK